MHVTASKKLIKKDSSGALPPPSQPKNPSATQKPKVPKKSVPNLIAPPVQPFPVNIPLVALHNADIDNLIDGSIQELTIVNDEIDFDSRYPLREYEFVELFVRCAIQSVLSSKLGEAVSDISSRQQTPIDVVDAHGRMGTQTIKNGEAATNFIDVADIIYQVLAEKVICLLIF